MLHSACVYILINRTSAFAKSVNVLEENTWKWPVQYLLHSW